jgi:hypothetical protein
MWILRTTVGWRNLILEYWPVWEVYPHGNGTNSVCCALLGRFYDGKTVNTLALFGLQLQHVPVEDGL